MNRRSFLSRSTSCSAHILTMAAVSPALSRRVFAEEGDRKVVATEKWGRLEEMGEGTWALISTPFESNDFKTVCNGGIVAGKKGVLAIEATMQPEGAKWLAGQALALTGRKPTDVVVTHFHGDHANGHTGYGEEGKFPKIWLTKATQEAAEKNFAKAEPAIPKFQGAQPLDAKAPTTIDLGGRSVKVIPRSGHTSSDVTIQVSDPKVVWTGDLFFNRMCPNYGDSIPDRLNSFAGDMSRLDSEVLIVPGHGPVAGQLAVQNYRDFLGVIETAATKAHKAGIESGAGAKEFTLPESLKKWMIWSPENLPKAFAAWYRVLEAK